MYREILLPVDGSEGTADLAAHAAAVATDDATVHVLSVMDTRNRFESPASGLAGEAWTEAERERAERAVAQAADILSGVATTTAVAEGIPHEEILARAGEVDAVVMGTHGRTGLDHYLIGSVAERVVRRSPTPVMTVRIDGAGE